MGWAALGVGAGATSLAYYHGVSPTSQLYGATLCRRPEAGRMVALTYDDGPNTTATERLLDLLDRHSAKATFFVIGEWAAKAPELVREVSRRGHALGNHTYSHPTMPRRSAAAVREELARTKAAVEDAADGFSTIEGRELMRPPYGHRRPGTLREVRAAGYVPVLWSVTCFDWRRTATVRSIARHARRAGAGDIVLLHDGSNHAIDADRSKTLAATERVLERLGERGYRFVSVPELVASPASSK